MPNPTQAPEVCGNPECRHDHDYHNTNAGCLHTDCPCTSYVPPRKHGPDCPNNGGSNLNACEMCRAEPRALHIAPEDMQQERELPATVQELSQPEIRFTDGSSCDIKYSDITFMAPIEAAAPEAKVVVSYCFDHGWLNYDGVPCPFCRVTPPSSGEEPSAGERDVEFETPLQMLKRASSLAQTASLLIATAIERMAKDNGK